MADNVTLAAELVSGIQLTSTTVATDDVGGAQHQYVKLEFGADGTATKVSASDPLPVVQTGALSVTANAGTNLNTSALATEATLSTYTGNQRASSASNTGSQVSVTASPAVTVLASNASRKGYRIYYPSAVWVSYGGTASSSTFLLPAGSVDEMTDGLIYTGAISAISVSGTITAYVVEW